ncbi:MAG TPA: DUF3298 and DUF4163 domain-containing protein [Clostridiales bacterium]|nr:DUF3298 and DUF4163 domain-containing protein [Clostridiales bacterium]
MTGNQITVREKELKQDLYYKNTLILRYFIKYPQFISEAYPLVANKLNALYRTKAVMYERSNIMNLYQMAMVEYEYSIANNYPIHVFEAYVDFKVTYNHNCIVSLYFDQYEYAGGAHGLTVRHSDTWDFSRSKKLELADLFPGKTGYRDYLIQFINNEIGKDVAQESFAYFENYAALVNENFKVNNFYLEDGGVVIYFQQYDIAPYASGIPTFFIPCSQSGMCLPRC